jgi:hypothetical protein
MRRLNSARVGLKHAGTFPSAMDVASHSEAVGRFFADNTPRVFGVDLAAVSLVDLVANPLVRADLTEAQTAMAASDYPKAVGACAIALERLIDDYESSTRDDYGRSPFEFGQRMTFLTSFHMRLSKFGSRFGSNTTGLSPEVEGRLAEFIDTVKESIEAMQSAIKFLSLGLDYRRYARFQMLTPYVFRTINDPQYQTDSEGLDPPSPSDAQFCLEFVIESALRLQEFDYAARP